MRARKLATRQRNPVRVRTLVAVALTVWLGCAFAQAERATGPASRSLDFSVAIPAVVKVISFRREVDGDRYVLWTNVRSTVFAGRTLHFSRVGESVVLLPRQKGALTLVHGL